MIRKFLSMLLLVVFITVPLGAAFADDQVSPTPETSVRPLWHVTPTPTPKHGAIERWGEITSGTANVYSAPDEHSECDRSMILLRGRMVWVKERIRANAGAMWYSIDFLGTTFYVPADLVTVYTKEESDAYQAKSTASGNKITAVPTAAPSPTPTAVLSPTPMPELTASSQKSSLEMTEEAYWTTEIHGIDQDERYSAVHPDQYSYWPGGVLTFRGDFFRRNAAFGTAEIKQGTLSVRWKRALGSLHTADGLISGMGWPGQPAIVKWPMDIRELMNLYDEKKAVTALREVIFAAQDGKVYFLDLLDGQPTRDSIDIGFPLRGSVSVDTQGRPMIGFGQGESVLPDKVGAIGYYIYNMLDSKRIVFINGRAYNNKAQEPPDGAFDGAALFLWNSDAVLLAGGNGRLYSIMLRTSFSLVDKNLKVYPLIFCLSSKADAAEEAQTGVQGSVAEYGKYVFYADQYGALRCVDANEMRTIWALDTGDNTDATPALDFDDDGRLWLYTGNTNYARLMEKDVSIRRVNAMTGEVDWTYEISCVQGGKTELSGCKASPIIGENAIDSLVIFTVNRVSGGGSTILALDKETGALVWAYPMAAEAVSSPVAIYNEAGDAWIIQGDLAGNLHMLDGRSGTLRSTLALGGRIEGSPVVYRDMLVIGTAGEDVSYMYGIEIR